MAALLQFNLSDPQDAIDTYGTGALIRVERDTVSTFATASEITTIVIVAGVTEYEYPDQTGVAGTHWGRWRISKASPSVAADYSGYLGSYRYGDPAGQVVALETAKAWLALDGTADDGWLALAVGAVNTAGVKAVGVDLGPSPDTTRTYELEGPDGQRLTVRHDTRLWIPGGIRAFTTVEVSSDGTTWVDVTTDVRIGPLAQALPYGEPGAYIEFKSSATSYASFASYEYVRITGTAFATFGWDAWPWDLVQDAVAAVQRMSLDRARGGMYPSEVAAMRYLHLPLWHSYKRMYFPGVG